MNVTELFQNLALGELRNLAMGGDGSGVMPPSSYPVVIKHGNEGLTRLYSRYNLLEKTVLVEMREARVTYPLISANAESKWIEGKPYPYIRDNNEPFTDDVIKIVEVYDSLGRKLVLNDEENRDSVFTPSPKVLQVPRPVPGAALGVKYQAKHPPLSLANLTMEILLPETLHGALTAFIAWQVYANMNTQEAAANAQEHQANYEAICTEAVMNDLVNTSISTTNTKFEKRGWK